MLRHLERKYSAFGSLLFIAIFFFVTALSYWVLAVFLSFFVGVEIALQMATFGPCVIVIVFFSPLCWSLLLLVEALWKLTGIYKVFSVQGFPFREKFNRKDLTND